MVNQKACMWDGEGGGMVTMRVVRVAASQTRRKDCG